VHSEILTDDQPRRSFIELSRRAQIIDCAIEAIAELGFARASLAQIARRAGVSTGVILYHFVSKDELIREVVAHVYAAGQAFITPRVDQSSARAALLGFIRGSVAFIQSKPANVLAVMNIIRAGRADSGEERFDHAVFRPREAGFTAILHAGLAIGEFRPFTVPIMVTTIIEALDAIPPHFAADPTLDFDAYAGELAEIFDRATRSDP
jgi:TetR/AcrR family transcriptional regulator, fatty acid metabolism regulator protein